MGLESSTTIDGLNASWPTGSDLKNQGDDHLRLIKSVLQSDAVSKSDPGDINFGAVGVNAGNAQLIANDTDGPRAIYWDRDTKDWFVQDAAGDPQQIANPAPQDAAGVAYDNTESGLTAEDVQDAIDELAAIPASPSVIGKHSVWVDGAGMIPNDTNGTELYTYSGGANNVMVSGQLMKDAVDTTCQAKIAMPSNWDGGAIQIGVEWCGAAGATAGTALFYMDAQCIPEGSTIAGSWASSGAAIDAGGAAFVRNYRNVASITPTLGAPGGLLFVRITRAATSGTDTYGGDLVMMGLRVFYNITAAVETDVSL